MSDRAADFPKTARPWTRALDGLFAMRDRLLTDPDFHRWAARFPLTKPFARRKARAAFDLCAGFVYSQTLQATIRLGVLDRVKSGPIPESALLRALALPEPRALILVDAAVALGLLSRRSGGRIGLGMLGGAIAANPGISAMVDHHEVLYADLHDPVRLLKATEADTALAGFWPYSQNGDAKRHDDQHVAGYSRLMTQSQSLIADDVIDAVPFARFQSILDVGGGEGEFLLSLARRFPTPSLHLFDLPAVAERARSHLSEAGLTERIAVTGGSFLADELPHPFDAVTLIRIIHDHDDARALMLLERARRALRPGGTIIIAEPMSNTPDTRTVTDVYFAFYLLAMGRGQTRSPSQIMNLLRVSGFQDARRVPTARPMLTSAVAATTPLHR